MPLSVRQTLLLFAAPAVLAVSMPALAQDLQNRPTPPPAPLPQQPTDDDQIAFATDTLQYDNEADIVTATGNVLLSREGNRLRADKVVWNRKTGQVTAQGNVAITNPEGDIAYGDSIELTDTLKDGVVDNMLIVMQDGGRLAAQRGTRGDGKVVLERAAYSPCAVVDENGCPKEPTWQITAVRVTYDEVKQRVSYKGARVELFGLPLIPLPGLSHPVGEGGGGGLLVPSVRIDRVNGLEYAQPYLFRLAPNRDLTVTPHIYSDVAPMLEGTYRALNEAGAYQITGYGTYSSRIPLSDSTLGTNNGEKDFRGYLDASGRFQLDPNWSITGSARVASDRTFLRRYDISRDDRLRSTVSVERIDDDSYLEIAGWAVQTLRTGVDQGEVPIALPVIDYRKRLEDPVLGGRIELQANSLSIIRTEGQDTQRAFAGARWDLRTLTPLGQEVTFTLYGRGDVYHSGQNGLTDTISYRGNKGWEARGIAAAAVDVRYPLIGEAFGGTQRITPRVQIVATPHIANMIVPNEDSRAIELEDSNIFALNRYPGYDRFESGTRVTYGLEYNLDLPGFSIESLVGQSYRLAGQDDQLFPDGTGLSDRLSDIVGRTTIEYRSFLRVQHRFRLDKDSFAIRRNEIDATIGSRRTYAEVGYLRLNRNISNLLEDLRDREELRLGGRAQVTDHWSLFGSTVIDLTGEREDPLSMADGYEPVRHRLGILYEDDCLELGFTWRRDYEDTGDARRGNSYLVRLAFHNLGF